MGPTLPNHSSTHGSSHGSHSACLEDGQETDQLISSNASSRPLSWAVHGQPQQRPEQRPETLRRRTRSCSCSAAQAGPATAAGTAPRAPYAASADGSCGRSPRACRHALVRQKLRSDVRSRCGRSHCRRAGRHDPAATRASAGCMPCRELLARQQVADFVWPRGSYQHGYPRQNHLKSRLGSPTDRVEQLRGGYELIHDIIWVCRDT